MTALTRTLIAVWVLVAWTAMLAADSPNLPLVGRILAEEDGHGIAGAVVSLGEDESFDPSAAPSSAVTDEEGRYRFDSPTPERPWLKVVAAGRASWTSRPRVVAGEALRVVEDLWLPGGGRLSGRVVDGAAQPVVGATVRAAAVDRSVAGAAGRFGSVEVHSDASGAFRLEGLTAGTRYRVYAEAEGYAPGVAGPFAVEAGTDLEDLTLALGVGAGLRFRLVDPEGQPVAATRVHVESEQDQPEDRRARHEVRSAEDGGIDAGAGGWTRVEHLRPGTFTVRIESTAWLESTREGLVLVDGETVDLGTVQVAPGRTVRGRVVDRDGTAVAEASIILRWQDFGRGHAREAESDANGEFSIAGLPGVSMLLEVSADGFSSRRVDVLDTERDAVDVRLDRQGVIRGVARLPDDGVPSDVTVRARPTRVGPAVEGESSGGGFEIPDLDPGTYDVEVRAPGWAPARVRAVKVRRGRTVDVGEIGLAGGRSLSGRVVRAVDGVPVPGARVRIDSGGGPPRWNEPPADVPAVSDAEGGFTFEALGPGRYTLTVEHPGFAPAQRSVELHPARPTEEAEVRLTAGGELRGVVLDADGLPVVDLDVFITRGTGGFDGRAVATRADGSFAFERLSPGTYFVWRTRSVTRAGFGPLLRTAEVREGQVATVEFSD